MILMIILAILSFSLGVFLLVYFGSKKQTSMHEMENTTVSMPEPPINKERNL